MTFQQPLNGPVRYGLPQTFTVFGQKFVPDSWALSQNVSSSIRWVENGETNKVGRRMPSALDVAFSVLANNQIVPELVAEIKGTFPNPGRPHAQKLRDGLPYQHNLAAVRAVIDQQRPDTWTAISTCDGRHVCANSLHRRRTQDFLKRSGHAPGQ